MIDSKKLKIFEKKINYKFKNNKLLIQSLTHPSFYLENEKKIKINEFESCLLYTSPSPRDQA